MRMLTAAQVDERVHMHALRLGMAVPASEHALALLVQEHQMGSSCQHGGQYSKYSQIEMAGEVERVCEQLEGDLTANLSRLIAALNHTPQRGSASVSPAPASPPAGKSLAQYNSRF